MAEFFSRLVSSDFLPHGHSFFWPPSLVWINVVSDSILAIACFVIPFTLSYFVRRRTGTELRWPMLVCAVFMSSCGIVHFLVVWDLWHSAYWLEGLVKAIAAILAIAMTIVAAKMAPMVLKMAMPKELAIVHDSLSGEREGRRIAEEKLRLYNEAQLLASEDKLRLCFEGASQAILAVWSSGYIALLNRRTEEMFGYSRQELLDHEIQLLFPERFLINYAVLRDDFFATPKLHALTMMGRRKDGTEFPIEVGLSHVNTPEGSLAFGMISDVSERAAAAEELKRVNEELRRSCTELEQFAHVASHDLQEPLRMVTGYLQLIERRFSDRLGVDGKEFIVFAVDGARRMKALIKDLLEFSRAGTNATNFRPMSTHSVLEDAVRNLKTAIDESGATITADPLPPIVGDSVLLTQVFQNLIANAIKFHKGDGVAVHISVQQRDFEWVFSVRDNGIGIEARHLDRIFRIFERLHSIEEYSGSGIGLAISRKIVERHRGKIWVESQPGSGSTFFFSLCAELGAVEIGLSAAR